MMKNKTFYSYVSLFLLFSVLTSHVASAHTAGALSGGGGVLAGVWHPLSGVDHILAMIASGLLAYRLGGKALVVLPACFLLFMLFGALSGLQHSSFTALNAEVWIALSVLILGGILALNSNISLPLCSLLVSGFAFFHGFAHGSEGGASPPYIAGFLASTLALHLAAIFFAKKAEATGLRRLLPRIGEGIFAAGFVLVLGVS